MSKRIGKVKCNKDKKKLYQPVERDHPQKYKDQRMLDIRTQYNIPKILKERILSQ